MALSVIMFCVIVVIVIFSVGFFRVTQRMEHRYDNLTVAKLCSMTRVHFPASSRIVDQDAIAAFLGPGYIIYVKLEMDRQDVPAFVTSIKRAPDEYVISRTGRLGTNSPGRKGPDWWRPGSVSRFITVQYGGTNDQRCMLIDLDRQYIAAVYIWG